MKKLIFTVLFLALISSASATTVKVKDIARFDGVRDNTLTGYGLVIGLAGTGDTARSKATYQSIKNTLENFDLIVSKEDISSRNVAAVLVTSTLPAFAQEGDKLDIQVSSIGDARSLIGGTLLLTPLKAVNDEVYALAQGALSVGGYQFEKFDSSVQKNHPTVGRVPNGAIVEHSINNNFVKQDGSFHLVLDEPDFTLVSSISETLQQQYPSLDVEAIHASRIKVSSIDGFKKGELIGYLSKIENTYVKAESGSRIVINERTGTIVSGADILVSDVVITHGELKVTINTDYQVSQPTMLFAKNPTGVQTQVIPQTEIMAQEKGSALYVNEKETNIANVVDGLLKLNLTTRDIISVLQALKKAGALRAELVIQ